ncbi:hypothetical protein FHEFKHOI_01599 [Candidatus Methanoperedenaceae archaeon GB50]|nr:hypothetical protein FHEFKHOI_01599 [Candidatus Methanoperedenaceae archaeon GB50]CAD7778221.1 MAG: hypothetical protein KBONHNOK_01099 [Candidatus Methanoperedenaceae archaeon GB50]
MLRVREIVEELRVFERSKVPFEVKVLGIATYIRTSSLGEDCQSSLSGVIQYLKPLFGRGVFEERLPLCIERRREDT